MPDLAGQLELGKCPYCSVDKPNLVQRANLESADHAGNNKRWWRAYLCQRCGGIVLASSNDGESGLVSQIYPQTSEADEAIPERAREYLKQAADTLHSPVGSIVVAGSAVDAMLKKKGYTKGRLYPRIDQAKTDNVITVDMAKWAHNIRLDANDQRHAEEDAPLPTLDDAKRCLDFAQAFGELLFVLPARVQRGVKESAGSSEDQHSEATSKANEPTE